MKVAIISSEKSEAKIKGFKLHSFLWNEIGKKEINFRDFDGVILDLSQLKDDDEDIDWYNFDSVLDYEITTDILYRPNSFIYVIGNPFISGHEHTVAHMLGLDLKEIVGEGELLSKTKYFVKSPYRSYLEKVKRYKYSFLPEGAISPITNNAELYQRRANIDSTPYLINRAGYTVAADISMVSFKVSYNNERYDIKPLYQGSLVLLPSIGLSATELASTLLGIKTDLSAQEAPDWVDDLSVKGQDELDSKIDTAQKSIDALLADKEALIKSKSELRKPLEVLYKSGKSLEEPVKSVFHSVGLKVTDPLTQEKVEFYLQHKKYKFVVEVKSTTGAQIDQKGLRQVIDWQNDAFDETGEDYKALVVVSTEFDKPLKERSDNILPDNLKQYAEKKQIAIITVKALFEISEMIKNNEVDRDEFVKVLANCNGLLVVSDLPSTGATASS